MGVRHWILWRFFTLLPFLVLGAVPANAAPVQLVPGEKYVAMGSSFAAGPGIGRRAEGSPAPCARSQDNYAHLIAARHRLQLVDVSCSGATTLDILYRREFGVPPQIEAVDAATRLVTITIGGNDVSYMANVIASSCLAKGGPIARCRPTADADVERVFAELAARMTAVVDATRGRAPNATIVLVDYFTIVPENGSCETLMPLSGPQLHAAAAVARRLAEITAQIAEQRHVRLVKLSSASAAHNVCSREPWIQGFQPRNDWPNFRTPPYHPNLAGMIGAADTIDRALFEH
jgi:lysophospholipase L1-like esterase